MHYQTLRVAPDASEQEIKKAYRTLIRQVHPDLAGPESAAQAAKISAAYEVLSDAERRRKYDESLAQPNEPTSEAFADSWGQQAGWDDDEVLDDVEVDFGPEPNRPPTARRYDPPPTAVPGPGSRMQDPPAAPPAGNPPVFVPPLQQPVTPSQRPKWITWWMIGFSIPAVLTIAFVLLGVIITAGQGGDPMLLVPVIIFWAAVIVGPLVVRRLTGPNPGGPRQIATDLLVESALHQQVHGAADRTEAMRRTDALLRTTVLPSFPALRLINDFQRPGFAPGLVDQVLVVGRTMIVIDSVFWQDGRYWWDGSRLQYEGRELEPFPLGVVVAQLRRAFPGVAVIGAMVLHAPSGRLDRPVIENAPISSTPIGGHGVPVLNPAGLIDFVRGVVHSVPDRDIVDVNLLTHLLRR